jgi:small subunit ribosomal protein S19
MTRSVKKGPFVAPKLLKKVERVKQSGSRDPIQTWARASVIIPEFVNHTFMVHNGRTFTRVYVTENMVGHRLGEFAPTRVFRGHSGKKAAETPTTTG